MKKMPALITAMFLLLVTFTWQNPDPSTVGNRLYCGTATGQYTMLKDVANTSAAYTDTTLMSGPHYCVATAYDTSGGESGLKPLMKSGGWS